MAVFKPTLPGTGDWARDPVGSWGRLWQAVNYSVDLYTATKKQLPVLYQRIAGYQGQLARFRPSPARDAIADQLKRHQAEVDRLRSSMGGVEGRVLEAIATVRHLGAQLGQAPRLLGLGQVQPLVIPAAIIAGAFIVASIVGLATTYQARKAESESLGQNVLRFAQAQGLNPDQVAKVADALKELPPPRNVGGGIFGDLGGVLPIVVGLLAAVYLGPTLFRQLSRGMARGGST